MDTRLGLLFSILKSKKSHEGTFSCGTLQRTFLFLNCYFSCLSSTRAYDVYQWISGKIIGGRIKRRFPQLQDIKTAHLCPPSSGQSLVFLCVCLGGKVLPKPKLLAANGRIFSRKLHLKSYIAYKSNFYSSTRLEGKSGKPERHLCHEPRCRARCSSL
jgi:hypothetical protein